EADETGEGRYAGDVHGPQAKSVVLEVPVDAPGHGVALIARQRGWEVLHHARVGVHRGEGLAVGGYPPPQEQPVGAEIRRRSHGGAGIASTATSLPRRASR